MMSELCISHKPPINLNAGTGTHTGELCSGCHFNKTSEFIDIFWEWRQDVLAVTECFGPLDRVTVNSGWAQA